jgi:hypothetical protein
MGSGRAGAVLAGALTAMGASAAARAQEVEPAAALADPVRQARAEAILAREEAQGRPFDRVYREGMKARLAASSDAELRAVEERGHGLRPQAPLGSLPPNLVYKAIPPCRIVDTRLAGGALAPGVPRDFYVSGGTGFETQGGTPAGCDIPTGLARAAMINFVAVNPAGAGNLRGWAFGAAVPNASILNYAAVGLNIANGLVVPLCDPGAITCTRDLTVRADVSATQVVADVVGYFVADARSQVEGAAASSGGTPVPVACANTGGVGVTLQAPDFGRIIVRGMVNLEMLHITGIDDEVKAAVGTTTTDCANAPVTSRVPGALPSFSAAPGMFVELHPARIFAVPPGSYTFYLNMQNTGAGAGNDRFRYGYLAAEFHPYD